MADEPRVPWSIEEVDVRLAKCSRDLGDVLCEGRVRERVMGRANRLLDRRIMLARTARDGVNIAPR